MKVHIYNCSTLPLSRCSRYVEGRMELRVKKVCVLGNLAQPMMLFRFDLIKSLVAEGVKVYCIASAFDADSRAKLESLGVEVIESKLNAKGLNPLKDLDAVAWLYKQVRRIQPDAMLSYFVKPVIYGALAGWLARVPLRVGMIEGLGNAFTRYKTGLTRRAQAIRAVQILLYRLALPKLHEVIFLNADDRNELLDAVDFDSRKASVLGGIGIDLDEFSYTPHEGGPIEFVFVGRLLREKGIYEYIEAADRVKKMYPEVICHVLGGFDEGNPFALTRDELDSYLASGAVNYVGHVNNVADWLRRSAVFVLPSYREGVPRSAQESMAIGRPVITTDVPGCRETVVDGVNGFMVPPWDAVALAQAMERFIQNPSLVNEMGRKSREIAEQKFDVRRINKKLAEKLGVNLD